MGDCASQIGHNRVNLGIWRSLSWTLVAGDICLGHEDLTLTYARLLALWVMIDPGIEYLLDCEQGTVEYGTREGCKIYVILA